MALEAHKMLLMGQAREGRVAPPPEPPTIAKTGPGGDPNIPDDFIEKAYGRGKITDDGSVIDRLKRQFVKATRETFVTQPELKGSDVVGTQSRTGFYGSAIDRLRTMHSAQRNARAEAQKTVSALFHNLTPEEYGLTNRYLFARDAMENVVRGMERRPGFDEQSVLDKVEALHPQVQANPDALRAVDSYKGLMNTVRDLLTEEGFLSPQADVRDWYYPHTVLDFARNVPGTNKILGVNIPKLSSGGLRWRAPRNTLGRAGSSRDISTHLADQLENYLTDVFTQIGKKRTLNEIGARYDVRNNPQLTDAYGKPVAYVADGGQVPPGFTRWDANKGYSRLRASSVAERYLGEMIDYGSLDNLAKVYKVDPIHFRQALEQVGIDNPEALVEKLGASLLPPTDRVYVIPEELARTMDHAVDTMNRAETRGLSEHLVRGFKTAVLNLSPFRYNFRNMVGDLQRMYVQYGNEILDPSLWKSTIGSVHNYYRHGILDGLTQQMLDGGVSSSGRIQSEYTLSNIDPHLKLLEHGIDSNNLSRAANTLWRVLQVIPETSSAREDIVRGVLVEMNNRRLARGEGLLHGVADRELVDGLMQNGEQQRAVNYIARKSLLDYGDFTPRENRWRNGWFPFYSWASGNFQFWSMLAKQTAQTGLKGPGPSQLARGSSMAMLKGVAGTAAIMGSIRAWNDMILGDDEERLPQSVQSKNHFIVPDFEHWQNTGELKALKDDEGKTVVWSTADALDDFMTYLGLDTAVPEAMSVARGTLTKEEYLERQKEHFGWGLAGPARTVLGQLGPAPQLLTQGIAGKRLFPDPLHPSDIPPEQRASAFRDALGLSALPGIEGGIGAVSPGGDVFQPSIKSFDIPSQLGIKSYRTPSAYMDAGMTQYESDLVRQMQSKMVELRDIKGRMRSEIVMKTNRQLDPETRQANFDTRLSIIEDQLTREIQQLSDRYNTLRRSRTLPQQ